VIPPFLRGPGLISCRPITSEDNIRQRVVEHIRVLAHPSEQLAYEKNVPIANVPAELAIESVTYLRVWSR